MFFFVYYCGHLGHFLSIFATFCGLSSVVVLLLFTTIMAFIATFNHFLPILTAFLTLSTAS